MLDPCCGYPLQKGTKIIAIIDMAISIFSIVFFGFLIILVLANGTTINFEPEPTPTPATTTTTSTPATNETTTSATTTTTTIGPPTDDGHVSEGTLVVTLIFAICYSTAVFYLSRFLLHATMARDYDRIHQWYVIAVVLLVVRVALYLMGLAFSMAFFGSIGIIGFFYQIYSIWVVVAYKKELAGSDDFRSDETLYLRRGTTMQYFKL